MILPSFGSKASTVRRSALNNGGISENFGAMSCAIIPFQADFPLPRLAAIAIGQPDRDPEIVS